jgi:predicted RNase H-like HicB family nuclease
MKYLVVIEKGESGFGAYVPDLPGCSAAAESEPEVRQLIREAIEFHIEGLRENGQPIRLQAPRARSLKWAPPNPSFERTGLGARSSLRSIHRLRPAAQLQFRSAALRRALI